MFFFSFSNRYMQFGTKEIIWKTYIIIKLILRAKQVELIDRYKFAKKVLDESIKTFVMHITALETLVKITIYSFQAT